MIIPFQQIFTSALLGVGMLKKGGSISEGKILDFCKEECLDSDMKQHCTAPFLLKKSTCYHFEWKTDATLGHTTMEVRDAKSDEIVYYRDTNGDWTAEKSELVYVDFKPKTPNLCGSTVEYTISTCK